MPPPELKHCVVAYADPARAHLWRLDLPLHATVADALEAARQLARDEACDIPWDSAPVGVFGEPCSRERSFEDGDRIEIYRPLACDPRERRRARVRRRR
jgi:putative ubiquitin-RnfH superfamily antitoxin RatB of RatAB toxin-antitoxin module